MYFKLLIMHSLHEYSAFSYVDTYNLLNLKKFVLLIWKIFREFNLHCNSSVKHYKNDNFTLIWRIFREIDFQYIPLAKIRFDGSFVTRICGNFCHINLENFFTLLKKLLSRKLCDKMVTVNFDATIISQKFREINFLLSNFTLNLFDVKRFAWQRIFRFSTVWH